MQKNPNEKILRLREVMARTGLGRSMVYELIGKKQFPTPINLGVRAVGWLASEIDAWIAKRIAVSRSK